MRAGWRILAVALLLSTGLSLARQHAWAEGGAELKLTPSSQTVAASAPQVELDVTIVDAAHLGAYEVELAYDSAVLQYVSFKDAGFLATGGGSPQCIKAPPGPTAPGLPATVRWGCNTTPNGSDDPGANGSGTLCRFIFKPVGNGTSQVRFTLLGLATRDGDPLFVGSYQNAVVTIGDPDPSVPTAAPPAPISGGITPTIVVPSDVAQQPTPLVLGHAGTPEPGSPSGSIAGEGPNGGDGGSAAGGGITSLSAGGGAGGTGGGTGGFAAGARSGPHAGTGPEPGGNRREMLTIAEALLILAGVCLAAGMKVRSIGERLNKEV